MICTESVTVFRRKSSLRTGHYRSAFYACCYCSLPAFFHDTGAIYQRFEFIQSNSPSDTIRNGSAEAGIYYDPARRISGFTYCKHPRFCCFQLQACRLVFTQNPSKKGPYSLCHLFSRRKGQALHQDPDRCYHTR